MSLSESVLYSGILITVSCLLDPSYHLLLFSFLSWALFIFFCFSWRLAVYVSLELCEYFFDFLLVRPCVWVWPYVLISSVARADVILLLIVAVCGGG